MVKGQTKKDVIKGAQKKPNGEVNVQGIRDEVAKEKQIEAYEAATNPAKLESAAKDLGSFRSGLGVITEEGTPQPRKDTMLDEAYRRVEERKERRGIASGLKDLSERGALTNDLLKEARQRATGAGVTDEQFSSFMGKEDIKTQNSATESKGEAAQNVMFQNQYGTGLGALAAMQDPNYELGSGSSLNQPARAIGPASGKYRRASRRLRRQGYGDAAQAMAMNGETDRLSEPAIDTAALRGLRMSQKIVADKEAQKQDKIAAGSGDMFDVMGMKKPKSNVSIQEPMAKPNESSLDKTLNKRGLGVTNEGFGPVKRKGQRI
jgi:hypothetical protein